MAKIIDLTGLSRFLLKCKRIFVESDDVRHIVVLSQTQYDALSTKDSNTLYFIK